MDGKRPIRYISSLPRLVTIPGHPGMCFQTGVNQVCCLVVAGASATTVLLVFHKQVDPQAGLLEP